MGYVICAAETVRMASPGLPLGIRRVGGGKLKTRPYSSSAPNTFPVLGLTMWTCLQARQVTAS
jgi:hypothetical protein